MFFSVAFWPLFLLNSRLMSDWSAPLCYNFSLCLTSAILVFLGVDSRMDRQRRLRLVQVLKSKDGALASPPLTSSAPPSSPNPQPQSATTPANPTNPASPGPLPSSPPPITAVPLALVEAGAFSAPLDKGKRVVEVVSDDEDSAEGQVFKRQRTQHAPQMVTSATSSSHGAESLREDPPSATSPP